MGSGGDEGIARFTRLWSQSSSETTYLQYLSRKMSEKSNQAQLKNVPRFVPTSRAREYALSNKRMWQEPTGCCPEIVQTTGMKISENLRNSNSR